MIKSLLHRKIPAEILYSGWTYTWLAWLTISVRPTVCFAYRCQLVQGGSDILKEYIHDGSLKTPGGGGVQITGPAFSHEKWLGTSSFGVLSFAAVWFTSFSHLAKACLFFL